MLVHDVLFAKGIQAGDGPVKQAILRHKTRLNGELQKLKIKRGITNNAQLADNGDERAGKFLSYCTMYPVKLTPEIIALIPRYVRVNTSMWSTDAAIQEFTTKGFTLSDPSTPKYASSPIIVLSLKQFIDQRLCTR